MKLNFKNLGKTKLDLEASKSQNNSFQVNENLALKTEVTNQSPTSAEKSKGILTTIAEQLYQFVKVSAFTMASTTAIYYVLPYMMQYMFIKNLYDEMTPDQLKEFFDYVGEQLPIDEKTSMNILYRMLQYSAIRYLASPIITLPNIADGAKLTTVVAVGGLKAAAPYVPAAGPVVTHGLTYAYNKVRDYGFQTVATVVSTTIVAADYMVNRPRAL